MKNEEYTNDSKDVIEEKIDGVDNDSVSTDSEQPLAEYAYTAKLEQEASEVDPPLSLSGLEEYGETAAFIDEDLEAYHNIDNLDSPEDITDEDEAIEDSEDEDYNEDEESEAQIDEGEGEDDADEESESCETTPDDSEEPKPRRVDALFDFIEITVFSVIGVFLLLTFFFRYTIVDGGSMMNTLQHGDKLLLSSFLYQPECGDIVVIQDQSTVIKAPIVKRIIATEGQTVKFTRYAVYVDGVKLDEPYVYTADYENALGQPEAYRYSVYPHDSLLDYVIEDNDDTCYSVTVPEGMVFVMGDHRNNSKDSREIGMIHEDAIIGKAIYRFSPFDSMGKID